MGDELGNVKIWDLTLFLEKSEMHKIEQKPKGRRQEQDTFVTTLDYAQEDIAQVTLPTLTRSSFHRTSKKLGASRRLIKTA